MSRRTAGVLLVAVSAASFGAMAIFARLAYDGGADVAAVLFLRFALAAPCMAALLRLRRLRWPRGRDLLGLTAMGAIGYVGQSAAYFTALTLVSAGLVGLLLYAYPAIVTVLSAVFLGARLTAVKVVALAVASAGAALTILPEVFDPSAGPEGGNPALGIALGGAAALVYSVYILAGSRLTPRHGALPSSAVIMAAAALVYGVVVLVQRPAFPATAGSWAAVVAIALVSTVVAITTFFAGMSRLGPADASTLSTFEPVITVVLAAAVLGERISAVQVAGGVLILAAVVLLARAPTGPEADQLAPGTRYAVRRTDPTSRHRGLGHGPRRAVTPPQPPHTTPPAASEGDPGGGLRGRRPRPRGGRGPDRPRPDA